MNQTQPNTRTLIGLVIGAIVLVAGLLLISNAGRSGDSDTPPPTQTRVSLQPTATPQPEPSPTPVAQTRNEDEDPDGDGFFGDADFCPDEYGMMDGCPDNDGDGIANHKDTCPDEGDMGYGVDGVGCPNPPTDGDNDGVFDNDDACPNDGDMGYGVDGAGCPNPPTDGDNDGVFDNDDACPDEGDMGYGVDGVGCHNPPTDGDNDGVFDNDDDCPNEGDMGYGVDGVGCANPPTDGDADGVFDNDDDCPDEGDEGYGVDARGCPNPPDAVSDFPFSYRFEVGQGVVCTVTINNIGDGDPATWYEQSGLTPDENGMISGSIDIELGADDVPDASISCVPTSAPAMMPYRFENVGPDDNCSVQVVNVGDGDPATLSDLIPVIPDQDGVVEGAISIVLGEGDTPEVVISCIATPPPAVAAQMFTFTSPDDFPPDVAFCDVVVYDADDNPLQTFDQLVPVEGVIEVVYEFVLGSVSEPLSARIFCAIVDDFGTPQVTPEPEPTEELTPEPEPTEELTPEPSLYDLTAQFICLPLEGDARTFALAHVLLTATGEYPSSYQLSWVSGEVSRTDNVVVFNTDTGTLYISDLQFGTGLGTGTLTLVPYDDNYQLQAAQSWVFNANCTTDGGNAFELNPNFWCQRNFQDNSLMYLGVLINGVGNYPHYYQSTWVSGDYTEGPVTVVWNSTLTTFNLANAPGPGMTTGTLTLVPYNRNFQLMPELTIVYELDCTLPEVTPEPEETPEPDAMNVHAYQFYKEWSGSDVELSGGGLNAPANGSNEPTEDIDNLIVATSSIARAECDWTDGGYLDCDYQVLIDGQWYSASEFYVPEGESYTVTETPIEGWVVASGVGTFNYDQCRVLNLRTGNGVDIPYTIIGYCGHTVYNVMPDTNSYGLVNIEKEWIFGNWDGGMSAPAEGGGYGPNYDIPGMIIATSDYGTLTCDWIANIWGGDLDCYVQLTTRPPWYDGFYELPIPPGGSYTVTENLPEGWVTLRGTGTFTIDSCLDKWGYTEEYWDGQKEQTVWLMECWHPVVNKTEDTNFDAYYGVVIEKVWSDAIETALTNRGLNSPALGGGGPDDNYYPLIRAYSAYGEAWCDWYKDWGLYCYYQNYGNAPFPVYNALLVKYGESYTVTEVPINGYVNVSGLGTFTSDDCQFFDTFNTGEDWGDIPLSVCRHVVENRQYDTNDYYRVVIQKEWHYNRDDDRGGLRAPAQGNSGYSPFQNIPNFITIESSIGIGTCSWVVNMYGDGGLSCVYQDKDGHTMPDTAALWVPIGEGYTVTETLPDGWEVMRGVGSFDQCDGYVYGDTCYHTIENVTNQLQAYRVYIAKFWHGLSDCDEYEDCETAFANSGLNAPAQGGYYNVPGPDYVIRNIITVTSDLGTLVCDWVPDYYDVYFGVAFGELECRLTSVADGYPSYYDGLWVAAGGTYTVTENVPAGWRLSYGTGTFSIDACMDGAYNMFARGQSIPVGGYYEDDAECWHMVMNVLDEGEPTPTDAVTPEPTPTDAVTPEPTPTDAVTPEPTPTDAVTPEPTPTDAVTPEPTPTDAVTPEPTPTDAVTPEPTPTDAVTPEPTPTDAVTPEPTPEGVCGDYAFAADGFPIINLSNAPCGGDSEGAVINFSPIETHGEVCINEVVYHSNGGGTWDVWRTAADMQPENLTSGVAGVISMAPTRSPNGRYVVYVSNADGDWELYLRDLDNPDAPAMQLTNNTQAIDLDPVFSPSGRYIAYESNVDGNWEIRLIDLTTGEKFRITRHPASDINPFWHPSGESLLFQSDRTGVWQIFVATSIAGNTAVNLLSDGLGEDYDPTYSPNGARIAFRSQRDGEMGIYIMNSDGSDVRKVSLDGYASTPVWDSSNRYIAYQASKAGESLNDIFVYDTVSGETRQLTSSVGNMATVQDVAPTWLCNSTTVVFTSSVGNNRLYALNALPMSAPPVDLSEMSSWTENDFNNRDPQNTPSEENGSRMGALPPPRTR